MARYGDNCREHDLPYGDCIECERDENKSLRTSNERLRALLEKCRREGKPGGWLEGSLLDREITTELEGGK